MKIKSPYIRTGSSVPILMLTAITACGPVIAAGFLFEGTAVFLRTGVCIGTAMTAELVVRGLFARDLTIHDLSAALTGVVLALMLPQNTPLWLAAVSSAAAILAGKQLFGGLGKNIFNPALIGLGAACVVILFIRSHAALMTPLQPFVPPHLPDGIHIPDRVSRILSHSVLSFGSFGGAAFLIPSALTLLILFFTRTLHWEIPLFAALGAMGILSASFMLQLTAHPYIAAFAASGAFLFVISVVAAEPVSSPLSSGGRIAYGFVCGSIFAAVWLLTKNSYAAVLSLLACNLITPLLDRIFPSRFFR
jgi:electron transport complex protein RnfD